MKKTTLLLLSFICTSFLYGQKILVEWNDQNSSGILKHDTDINPKLINGTLQIPVDKPGKCSFEISIPESNKDVSHNTSIRIPVSNTGMSYCRISARMNGKKWVAGSVVLVPGESDEMEILFLHTVDKAIQPFPNMDGVPGGGLYIWDPIDDKQLTTLQIEIQSEAPVTVSIGKITAYGDFQTGEQVAAKDGFFPFIDEYGQFKHREWPGKIHADNELVRNLKLEMQELDLLQGPQNFNQYGGWKDGPALKATGNFYTAKVDGMWWLVDPEGKLFWSHGINCVGFGSGSTQVSDREKYFTGLKSGEPRFNFYQANLARKFGEKWREQSILHIHNRLKSWGVNTIANWSDASVYLSNPRRTPYTANIGYRAAALDGEAYKFPDVFDPQFRESLEASIRRSAESTLNDSWCMGYFVDNELYLSDYAKWPAIIMKQKPGGAAKNAFVGHIKTRHSTIKSFNSKYKTKFGSWEQLLKATSLPEAAVVDFSDFNKVMVDRYYSTCSEAMKKFAPGKLYMGNRFNLYRIYYPNDTLINYVIKKAAEYCDVVSINYYRFACEDLLLPEGIDKPIIIGEFHFGALDRGLCHTGLRNVATQEQRSEIYQYYLKDALENRQIVGTHWFQYGDQPYTGRSDGENYQIGFVDICDTPYPETIKALRNTGYSMYNVRSSQGKRTK